ncbi:hypothetical protein [Nodosilinea sp. P-1105]|uniref:hypothetical protein n=1 Tax=Nodosilinea sp. P-1105 TaxID=2546229 RepID=UPI00146E6DD3|nr:hypothetical protein [Nodosilinea sp. P-1105]NMF86358.1 hypothetical protein [Nodosilinea sp. P-1105]
MTNFCFAQVIQRSTLVRVSAALAWGAAVSIGLLGVSQVSLEASEAVTSERAANSVAETENASAIAQAAFPSQGPGQYLYGQAPEPEQVGFGYVVLDSSADGIYGALYFPSSSFDCFHGQVQGNELAMTVIDSYSQEPYAYSIALASDTTVASSGASDALEPLSLKDFYQLDGPSENDLRMLAICRGVVASD